MSTFVIEIMRDMIQQTKLKLNDMKTIFERIEETQLAQDGNILEVNKLAKSNVYHVQTKLKCIFQSDIEALVKATNALNWDVAMRWDGFLITLYNCK